MKGHPNKPAMKLALQLGLEAVSAVSRGPAIPTGLAGSPSSPGVVEITWDAQSGVTFNLYVGGSISVPDLTGSSYSFNSGTPGDSFYISLTAKNPTTGMESPQSPLILVTAGS